MTEFTEEKLAELRAVARCAFPDEEWAIWEDLKEGGYVHVGNARGVIPEGEMATAEDAEPNPVAKAYTPELATHIATFDPPTALALIDALEAKTAEVEGYKQHFPCDGGCSYGDGPQEECSLHGRDPRELWGILAEARAALKAKDSYVGDLEEQLKHIKSLWRATGRAEADAHRRAEKAEAAREELQGVLERVKDARANHPECDKYDDDSPITCGWKRTVQSMDAALQAIES